MFDFDNRRNRFIKIEDVPDSYMREIKKKTLSDEYYPRYHVAPKHGLLNDPNGLAYHNGEHHIFYQWFPLGPVHGLKYWYHLSTKDFVDYTDHGIALYPDEDFDSHGCYSGSAVSVDEDLYLFYTGNKMLEDHTFIQSQCLAVMGNNNSMIKKGVIANTPADFTHDFRDPSVIKRDDKLMMFVGGKTIEGDGALALYVSDTVEDDFKYQGKIDAQAEDFGYMWECPSYYEEKDQGVLILSPQGISSQNKYDYKNVFSVVYAIGDKVDVNQQTFTHGGFIEMDKGFDFYAPQTYLDHQGRRIMLGWLGNSKSKYPTDKNGWAHMLTIPREIMIKNDTLRQRPLAELKALRTEKQALHQTNYLTSKAFELVCDVEDVFQLSFENDKGDHITFSSDGMAYCLDRTHMSEVYAEKFGTVRYAKRKIQKNHTIRIFVDHSSIEIFCDDGETVLTSRFFIHQLSLLKIENITGNLYYLSNIKNGQTI